MISSTKNNNSDDYFKIISYSDFGWGESKLASYAYRNEKICNYFKSIKSETSNFTLLDLGSGEGVLADLLKEYFTDIICIDADEKTIKKGQQRFPHLKYYQSKLSELPKCNYDIITIFGAIYYCSPDEIDKLCKSIGNNKIVIIDCLNDSNLGIFKNNGFCIKNTYSYFRPKHRLHLLHQLLIRYYWLLAIERNKSIRYYIENYKHKKKILFIINRAPILLKAFNVFFLIIQKIMSSLIIYRLLFLFGKDKQLVYRLVKNCDEPLPSIQNN